MRNTTVINVAPASAQLRVVAAGGVFSGNGTLVCAINGNVVTCHIAPFAPGEVAQIQIFVEVSGGVPGSAVSVRNTASVAILDEPSYVDPNQVNNVSAYDSTIITPLPPAQ